MKYYLTVPNASNPYTSNATHKGTTVKGCMLVLCLISGLAGAASAETLSALPPPPSLVGPGHQVVCAASSFNADDSVKGTCKSASSTACSGRGCQPVTTTVFYIVAWSDLAPALGDACYSVRHHLPQPDQLTLLNGHTQADCPFALNTGTVVMINGTPYWYVATSADGAFELVNWQAGSLLVAF